MTAKNMIYR